MGVLSYDESYKDIYLVVRFKIATSWPFYMVMFSFADIPITLETFADSSLIEDSQQMTLKDILFALEFQVAFGGE